MKRYTLSVQALKDVSSIIAYFEEYSDRSARRFEAELIQEFIDLGTLPAKYRHDSGVVAPPVRVRNLRSYLIYYDADTTPLTILRVVHGSRDLPTMREEFTYD